MINLLPDDMRTPRWLGGSGRVCPTCKRSDSRCPVRMEEGRPSVSWCFYCGTVVLTTWERKAERRAVLVTVGAITMGSGPIEGLLRPLIAHAAAFMARTGILCPVCRPGDGTFLLGVDNTYFASDDRQWIQWCVGCGTLRIGLGSAEPLGIEAPAITPVQCEHG